jgi:hypothetical protein
MSRPRDADNVRHGEQPEPVGTAEGLYSQDAD